MPKEKIHIVAVGGTAMAPLAILLSGRGYRVSGSDTALYPPMSDLLARSGISVAAGFSAANIADDCDRIIIGNAVARENVEAQEVLRRGLPHLSLPQAVDHYFLAGKHPVVVAGTHGKTTTSALLAWLLLDSGRDPGFLVGGEMMNLGRGFHDGAGPIFLLEGDEYNAAFFDRGPKFLHYRPRTLLLNNVEFDHADLYPNLDSLKDAFRRLVSLVPQDGTIVANIDDPVVSEIVSGSRAALLPVSLASIRGISARAVSSGPKGTSFTVMQKDEQFAAMESPLFGEHNLRNALMAVAAARSLGLSAEEIARALMRFGGVKRRLEILADREGVTYVDDFAHHPTAVRETLCAARMRWPGRRLWAVFEPRSITAGRKIFEGEYEKALSVADAAVLAPVFHANRISAEGRIDREKIVRELASGGRLAFAPARIEEIEPLLAREVRAGDVVILMSSGDFAGLRKRISRRQPLSESGPISAS